MAARKIALKTAKRKLKKLLQDQEELAQLPHFEILFNDDSTFNPFNVNFWIRNQSDEEAIRLGYYPDLSVSLGWASFYPTHMCHTRGKLIGKPFFLLPWQRDDFLIPMMGWKNPRGFPRVRKADFFSAKKNGKTTFCTGLIAGKLKGSKPNIETYNCSYTKSQAAKLFRDTAVVIENSPMLSKIFDVKNHIKRMIHPRKNSFFQVLPGEAGKKAAEGIDASLMIMDEIHLMLNRELYDFVELAGLAQDDFLLLSVSTVGKINPTAIWSERYEYAEKWIQNKILDLKYFGAIYAADPKVATCSETRRDVEQLKKANPSLSLNADDRGILDVEILTQEIREAENNPAKLQNVIQKVFNVPVAASAHKCIPIDNWNNCVEEVPELLGRPCFLGLDVASHEDLASISAFFPFTEEEKEQYLSPETIAILQSELQEGEEDEYEVDEGYDDDEMEDDVPVVRPGWLKTWVFCPVTKIKERETKGQPFYNVWAKAGHLIATRGSRISFKRIIKVLMTLIRKHRVKEIAYDQWGAESIIQHLENKTDVELVQVDQTFKGMNAGTQAILTLIIEEALRHEGNPVLEWCAGNAAASEKNGAIKFTKDQSEDKIDPLVSSAMAIGRACFDDEIYSQSYFDDEGSISEGLYL